jgi:hypothetical protein
MKYNCLSLLLGSLAPLSLLNPEPDPRYTKKDIGKFGLFPSVEMISNLTHMHTHTHTHTHTNTHTHNFIHLNLPGKLFPFESQGQSHTCQSLWCWLHQLDLVFFRNKSEIQEVEHLAKEESWSQKSQHKLHADSLPGITRDPLSLGYEF